MDAQEVLTIAGATAELVGLGLVVLDVRDARRSARTARDAYSPAEPMLFPVSTSVTMPYEVAGEQPLLEERVRRLEQQLDAARADYVRRIELLRTQLREEAFDRIRVAMGEAELRERALREFISDQLDAGIGRRVVGTILFALGVLLSALANLVA